MKFLALNAASRHLQIKTQRTELAELHDTEKELRNVVANQRRDMGGVTAAFDEHIQVHYLSI